MPNCQDVRFSNGITRFSDCAANGCQMVCRGNTRKCWLTLEQSEHAEMLAHIRQVENLERLFRLRYIGSIRHTPLASKIEVTCADYCHYVHKTGDVVYCDIPYEGTDSEYCKGFCNQTFYEWALSRNYPVYVSSYAIDHPAAKEVWSTRLRVLSQGSAFKRYSTERLYVFNSP